MKYRLKLAKGNEYCIREMLLGYAMYVNNEMLTYHGRAHIHRRRVCVSISWFCVDLSGFMCPQ